MKNLILVIIVSCIVACSNNKYEDASSLKLTGAVFVASNKSDENTLVGFKQFSDGSLKKIGEYKTGGKGTGLVELFDIPFDPSGLNTFADGIDPLASAYGVWRTPDQKNVLVSNAGDGTISSLRVQKDMSLRLTNVVKSGNIKPLSIASYGNLVYVASMGSKVEDPQDGNIAGYRIAANGALEPLAQSIRELTGRPASVEFTPDGKFLAVVEITTGLVKVYGVEKNGLLSEKPLSVMNSPISDDRFFALPIGTKIISAKGENFLFVTETRFVDAQGQFKLVSPEHKKKYPFLPKYEGQTGSTSSYKIDAKGMLSLVSSDVMAGSNRITGQQATCWVVASPDGKKLYVTNPLTSSLSTYSVLDGGEIKLLEEISYQAPDLEKYFLDMDLSADGEFINVISGNTGEVFVFDIADTNNKELRIQGAYPGSSKIHSYGLVTVAAQ